MPSFSSIARAQRLAGVLACLAAWSGLSAQADDLSSHASRSLSLALPMFFEPASGQSDASKVYVARGQNYCFRVSYDRIDFALRTAQVVENPDSIQPRDARIRRGVPARFASMSFAGANARAAVSGADELEGKANYLTGNDPARWRSQVSVFSKVKIAALYKGIDLAYYGNERQLEYDFTVAPEADPSAIRLKFDGIDKLSITDKGELELGFNGTELRQHRPIIYQVVKGVRREVLGGYCLLDDRTAGFALGDYDHEAPLIIDPVFSYSTYFGGNAADTGLAIKVDAVGAVYLAGETLSTSFPPASSTNSFQPQQHGGTATGDAFVAKLDSTGSKLVYFTYLGGSADDGAYDLAIDTNGNAYVTGFTVSSDFPTKNAIFPVISGSPDPKFQVYPVDAFVAGLNAAGSALMFSTYLGGTGNDVGSAIAVDSAGYVYVTGSTYSTNFPVVKALQPTQAGNTDAFVAKLAPGGTGLVYSTYLGGFGIDEGQGIAVDTAGYTYVSGYTASTNFPVTPNAWRTNLNGSGAAVTVYDAFVTKLSPSGQSLAYSTYFGGSQNDFGYRITTDAHQNAYLVGATQSADMPRTNSFNLALGNDGTNALNFDAFLTKFNPYGQPVSTTQFGGTANDAAWDVAVDSSGRAFLVGLTLSTNFPVVNPSDLLRGANPGVQSVFVAAFDTSPGSVLYSGYFCGSGTNYGYAIAVDSESNAYISGMTLSSSFPTKTGAFESSLSGTSDAFVAKIRLNDPMLNVSQSGGNFQISWPATAPDFFLQSTTGLSQPQTWTTVSQTPVLTSGLYLVSVPATNATTLFRLEHR